MLSHPLPISALVGRYPTNKLVGRSPLPGRNLTFDLHTRKNTDIIRYYPRFPMAIPDPRVGNYALLSLAPLSLPDNQPKLQIQKFSLDLHA